MKIKSIWLTSLRAGEHLPGCFISLTAGGAFGSPDVRISVQHQEAQVVSHRIFNQNHLFRSFEHMFVHKTLRKLQSLPNTGGNNTRLLHEGYEIRDPAWL